MRDRDQTPNKHMDKELRRNRSNNSVGRKSKRPLENDPRKVTEDLNSIAHQFGLTGKFDGTIHQTTAEYKRETWFRESTREWGWAEQGAIG